TVRIAAAAVPQVGPRGIRADEVALDDVSRGGAPSRPIAPIERDAVLRAKADYVARPGGRPADESVRRPAADKDAAGVPQDGAGRVRADVVALHDIAGADDDADGVADRPSDHVAGARSGSPDEDVRSSDPDAL